MGLSARHVCLRKGGPVPRPRALVPAPSATLSFVRVPLVWSVTPFAIPDQTGIPCNDLRQSLVTIHATSTPASRHIVPSYVVRLVP